MLIFEYVLTTPWCRIMDLGPADLDLLHVFLQLTFEMTEPSHEQFLLLARWLLQVLWHT